MKALLSFLRHHSNALASLWLVAVLVATLMPADRLPAVPGSDKLHHLVAYGVLCFLACIKPRRRLALWVIVFGAIFIGGAVEIIQPYVNRWGEWADFFANSAGAVLGWGTAVGLGTISPPLAANAGDANAA